MDERTVKGHIRETVCEDMNWLRRGVYWRVFLVIISLSTIANNLLKAK
jgi:hypothetical protein